MTDRIRRMVPRDLDEPRSEDGFGALAAVASAVAEEAPTADDLPSYVSPQEGVSRPAALTAAVVVRDYEETARKFTEIADEIAVLAKTCEDYMRELRMLREELEGHAQAVRDRGKVIFSAIETTAKMTQKVRQDAAAMLDVVMTSPLLST